MDIWNHVGFSKIMHAELWQYVREHNIPATHKDDEHIASFELYSSDPRWPWIAAYLEKKNLRCVSDTIFTKEELLNAQWMRVRSIWRTGYPEPMDGYQYTSITYSRDNYCEECGIGLKQIDSFRMKKVPSWGRKNFFSLFWVDDELFVSQAAKNAFEKDGITGITFLPVKNRKGTEELSGVFQLKIQNNLEEGLVACSENLCSSVVCPKCGRRKSLGNEGCLLAFRKQIFDAATDITKTGDYFGAAGNKAPAQEIIINQKTYQTIVQNKLDSNLMFYPIELV